MKKLLIILFLGFGFTAFANNGNNGDNTPNPTENAAIENTTAAKENKTAKISKPAVRTEDTVAAKPSAKKTSSRMCTTSSANTAGYGIGSFFVELVHSNNMKLIKMFLDE